MQSHYDDPQYSYERYWENRDYEHSSEIIALKKLLDNKRFSEAADIGGGFGRLTRFLSAYADIVYLIEPSSKQRTTAKKYLEEQSKTPPAEKISS